jgi:tetratricopeptide (TPR) repeat protein
MKREWGQVVISQDAQVPDAELGDIVKSWRSVRRLSRTEVACRTGIAVSTLVRIERGQIRPTPQVWLALVSAMKIAPLQLAIEAYVREESRCARLIALGDALLDAQHVPEAQWVVSKAESLNLTLFHGRYNGEVARIRGRIAFAQGAYEVACEFFGKMKDAARRGSPGRQAMAAYDYGLALVQCHQWGSALYHLEQARRYYQSTGDPIRLGRVHWALGTSLVRLGDWVAAETHYAAAVDLLSGDASIMYPTFGVILCRWALGDPRAFEDMVALAASASPDLKPRIEHLVGVALRQRGQVPEAMDWLDRALKQLSEAEPQWVDTQCERLVCLCLMGRIEEARQTWQGIIATHPRVERHNYMTLIVAGLMLDAERPANDILADIRHHEGRVEAIVEWAWAYRTSRRAKPRDN